MPAPIPILVVAFQNPDDVIDCLGSLNQARREPPFDVYVCENGGAAAFAALCDKLGCLPELCGAISEPPPCRTDSFAAVRAFILNEVGARVFVGDAGENLGYAGGVNRWLKPLLDGRQTRGALVLNPDTLVAPDALGALVRYAENRGKGMVTGLIARAENPRVVHTRGLRWRPFLASAAAVGRDEPTDSRPPADLVERELDAPSGAFIYVTQECLDRIGLMDERYFLYGEDLDWGLRAKHAVGIGYAFDAVVRHKGGTTIGSGTVRTASEFSTYLLFRSRVLFVRWNFPVWLAWTIVILLARALEFGVRGRAKAMFAAVQGIRDGLIGRTGSPADALARLRADRA